MHRNNFNKCHGIAAIAVVFICASAFAHDESAGSRNKDRVTEQEVCCYPLLAADDSARRAQQQAELRRREYQRREAEEAEKNRARQQAELRRREYQRRASEEAEANRRAADTQNQRVREATRHRSTENEQQAASQAREKRERQNVCNQKAIKEICDTDMAAPKIGMTLDQAHACFRNVRLVGKWSASDDGVPALIYRAGRHHLFVTNCHVVDWY